MSELEPLDQNLLKEARDVIFVVLQLQPSPFSDGCHAWLDDDVMIGCYPIEGGRDEFWFARYAFGRVTHRLRVAFTHDKQSGDVRDLIITFRIEPEMKMWWLMWFADFLRGRTDTLT